ncbi:hypothetical protein EI94DRAFT_1578498 [Lactarius quietus]|nr:hypothetical protein EI94DRAFT_1578498 [Lactarius quietus]
MGSTPHIGLLPSISVHPDEITSKSDSCLPLPDTSVGANKPSRLPRKIQFRVLVIGRANAGKTSILQRVCDTTESPVIYQSGKKKKREALDPSMDRGMHDIYNEFVFSGHNGYIFHDSCGFEAGSDKELEIVREFIRRKSRRRRLESRLHAIWYCVPMDNQRPELDLKFLKDICPDKDVPVIVVFTKYDQFLRNVKMHLEDYGDSLNPDYNESEVAEREFKEHYLLHLGDGVGRLRTNRFVKGLHKPETRCNVLLEETAEALNDDVVALMLLAVQSRDLELSIKVAVKR